MCVGLWGTAYFCIDFFLFIKIFIPYERRHVGGKKTEWYAIIVLSVGGNGKCTNANTSDRLCVGDLQAFSCRCGWSCGIDISDCVLATRQRQHGQVTVEICLFHFYRCECYRMIFCNFAA
jgi:hypothetical protein